MVQSEPWNSACKKAVRVIFKHFYQSDDLANLENSRWLLDRAQQIEDERGLNYEVRAKVLRRAAQKLLQSVTEPIPSRPTPTLSLVGEDDVPF